MNEVKPIIDKVSMFNIMRSFLMGPSCYDSYKEAVLAEFGSGEKNEIPIVNEENARTNYQEFPWALCVSMSSKRFEDDKHETDFRFGEIIILAPKGILGVSLDDFINAEIRKMNFDWRLLSKEGAY
jgi:hypothetical protein